jgi:hypothetical protein
VPDKQAAPIGLLGKKGKEKESPKGSFRAVHSVSRLILPQLHV